MLDSDWCCTETDCNGFWFNANHSLMAALVICLGWTPQPVIVTIGDNRDYIRVLLYSYYTTIRGWGGPPKVCFASVEVFTCRRRTGMPR